MVINNFWTYPLKLYQYLCNVYNTLQFSSVQSLSRVRLFATPWIAARQGSLSISNSLLFFLLLPVCVCAQLLDVWLFVTPWIVAHRAPLSMGFPWQNTGVGCHFLLQRIFLIQGLNPHLLCFLYWQVDSLPLCYPESPHNTFELSQNAKNTILLWGKKIILW